ncbi:MAG: hypothetical protein R2769_01810 [Saprospiraceae bacterium]
MSEELTKYDLPVIKNCTHCDHEGGSLKESTVKLEWLQDTTTKTRFWAANREAGLLCDTRTKESEKLVKGSMPKHVNPGDSVFISVDEGWAEGLDLDLGDEVVFNVQGTRIKTYIGAFRDIGPAPWLPLLCGFSNRSVGESTAVAGGGHQVARQYHYCSVQAGSGEKFHNVIGGGFGRHFGCSGGDPEKR